MDEDILCFVHLTYEEYQTFLAVIRSRFCYYPQAGSIASSKIKRKVGRGAPDSVSRCISFASGGGPNKEITK